jgi:hypothetical protein
MHRMQGLINPICLLNQTHVRCFCAECKNGSRGWSFPVGGRIEGYKWLYYRIFTPPPPTNVYKYCRYIFAENRVDNGYAARRTNDARTRRYGTRPRRAGHEAAPSLHPPRAVRSGVGRARLPARPLHSRSCRGGLPGGKPFTHFQKCCRSGSGIRDPVPF